MKSKTKTNKPKDGKEFERFAEFTRKLIAVPKDEILRREKAEKERKKKKDLK